jgi:magnesium chelatase family protein
LAVVAWLHGQAQLPEAEIGGETAAAECHEGARDLSDVCGQHVARRALEVAAAGGHNLLFCGPPGTGKTMLASRLPGILPPLTEQEALATAAVASVSQLGLDIRNWRTRSFRAPHHTASGAALVGGGSKPRPGEISLAHHGVLFLDELPEFNRNVLEVLREPMESGRIIISRAARQAEFPARFQLVAAMNPCPCGYHGDRTKDCKCSGEQVSRYRNKVSGPLLDRIDLFVEVARPKQIVIPGTGQPGEPSTAVRERVVAAHSIQIERQGVANARLEASGMKRHCRLRAEDESFVANAAQQLSLSPRGCQRVLKVARTIADLDGAKNIRQNHLAEAIGFRQPGRY